MRNKLESLQCWLPYFWMRRWRCHAGKSPIWSVINSHNLPYTLCFDVPKVESRCVGLLSRTCNSTWDQACEYIHVLLIHDYFGAPWPLSPSAQYWALLHSVSLQLAKFLKLLGNGFLLPRLISTNSTFTLGEHDVTRGATFLLFHYLS
jgi:hypothetical protein